MIEVTLSASQTFRLSPHSIELPNIRNMNENFQHEQQNCKLSFIFQEDLYSFLMTESEIHAAVYENEKILFTGIIDEKIDFTDNGAPEPIDLLYVDIHDRTSFFDVSSDSEIALINKSLSEIVEVFCKKCGIENVSKWPENPTVKALVINKGKKYLETLNNILFQYGYSWYFNEEGKFSVLKINLDSKPADNLTDSDFLTGLKISKNPKNYTAIKVNYNSITKKCNEQVYFEGNGIGNNNKIIPITVRPGQYYPYDSDPVQEEHEGKIYQNYANGYAESYRNFSGELKTRRNSDVKLIYTENHYIVEDWEGDISIDRTEFGARCAAVRVRNSGTEDAKLYQLAIRADAYYKASDNYITIGQGKKEFSYEAEYIYDSLNAEKLSLILSKLYLSHSLRICGSTEKELQPGSIYHIDTGYSGLQTAVIVISSTFQPETNIYAVVLQSIADFKIDIKKYKQSKSLINTNELQSKIENLIDGTAEIANPEKVSKLEAIAEKDVIRVIWSPANQNGISETIKHYQIAISKSSGHSWTHLAYSSGSSVLYTFNRKTDGYPEASSFDTWKFRIRAENIYGKFSEWVESSIDISSYGTWIPLPTTFTWAVAAEYGIDFQWNPAKAAASKMLYGKNTYRLRVFYADTLRTVIEKEGVAASYTFERNLDGFPEKPGITGARTSLDKFSASIEIINESGNSTISVSTPIDYSSYLGWKPEQPTIETRSSGRACTISPYNPESRYGKIRYRYLVNNLTKDGDTFYLPTPLANYYESVENYRDSTKPNVPLVADSPYTQTMPLQGQDATAFKEYTWNGESTVEYNDGSNKQLKYYETDPSEDYETVDVETILIGENEVEVNYWFDSANNIHHASFEIVMANPQDTEYRFKVQAFNETANIAPEYNEPVSVTARATSAYDVVNGAITTNSLAPDAVTAEKIATGTITADKIFVRALAAISANLGKITDGELVGNANNYWYLSDEYNEAGTQLIHRAGDFRVGGSDGSDYIQCTTQDGKSYNISIHASKFEITAVGTLVHGEFYVCNAGQDVDSEGRPTSYYAKITPSEVVVNGSVQASGQIRTTSTADVTPTSYDTDPLVIGTKTGDNIGIDGNEIMARNNGKASTLYLNSEGGNIETGGAITSKQDNNGSWWLNKNPRGKFVGSNGGTTSGWSPLLAGKTVNGKYEFGSLNNTLYLNYYKDSRSTNGIDKTIFDYTQDGTPNWNGNASTATSAKTAASCSGNSATATKADNVDGYHADQSSTNNLIRVTKGSDCGHAKSGYFAGMTSANFDGTTKWWHILSMDWSGDDKSNWMSQLFLPTQQGGAPRYRRNNASGTAIESSTTHVFITDENCTSYTSGKTHKIRVGKPSSLSDGDIWIE